MRLAVLLLIVVALLAPAGATATEHAATAPTKTVRVADVRVAYRSIGAGRPLVMVMGLAGTMDAWPPSFIDALARRGHRVILLDNQGVGRSTRRPGTLTIRRMADTTAGLIRRLRLRRPDVAGWSMGGMIVQSLLVRHPRRARRAVLRATAPGDGRPALPDPDAVGALAGGDPAALLGMLFGPAASPTAVQDYVADLARRTGVAPSAPPAIQQRQLAAAGAWMAGRDPDGARVRRLRQRVLVAGGADDRLLPIGNDRRLARIIRRSSYVEYAGAAHGFFIQEPRRFTARMLRFLRR